MNSDGRLGTISSSRRFKAAIEPMDQASEIFFALKPVRFHYRTENGSNQNIAVWTCSRGRRKSGSYADSAGQRRQASPRTLRSVNAMLLNEFLKEHKKAEGQRSRIEKQEATITELKSNLAAQTMQIQALMSAVQRVNAQVEL